MVVTELDTLTCERENLSFEFSVIEVHPPFVMYSVEVSRVCKVHIHSTSLNKLTIE